MFSYCHLEMMSEMTQEKGMQVSMTPLMKATVTAEAGTRVIYIRRQSEMEARLWHIKN